MAVAAKLGLLRLVISVVAAIQRTKPWGSPVSPRRWVCRWHPRRSQQRDGRGSLIPEPRERARAWGGTSRPVPVNYQPAPSATSSCHRFPVEMLGFQLRPPENGVRCHPEWWLAQTGGRALLPLVGDAEKRRFLESDQRHW